MAGVLRMQIQETVTTAQSLASRADDLDKELEDIARNWSDLSATWIGKAGSAYDVAWDEWHEDAKSGSGCPAGTFEPVASVGDAPRRARE